MLSPSPIVANINILHCCVLYFTFYYMRCENNALIDCLNPLTAVVVTCPMSGLTKTNHECYHTANGVIFVDRIINDSLQKTRLHRTGITSACDCNNNNNKFGLVASSWHRTKIAKLLKATHWIKGQYEWAKSEKVDKIALRKNIAVRHNIQHMRAVRNVWGIISVNIWNKEDNLVV